MVLVSLFACVVRSWQENLDVLGNATGKLPHLKTPSNEGLGGRSWNRCGQVLAPEHANDLTISALTIQETWPLIRSRWFPKEPQSRNRYKTRPGKRLVPCTCLCSSNPKKNLLQERALVHFPGTLIPRPVISLQDPLLVSLGASDGCELLEVACVSYISLCEKSHRFPTYLALPTGALSGDL